MMDLAQCEVFIVWLGYCADVLKWCRFVTATPESQACLSMYAYVGRLGAAPIVKPR
jgi:hypothetical protein